MGRGWGELGGQGRLLQGGEKMSRMRAKEALLAEGLRQAQSLANSRN